MKKYVENMKEFVGKYEEICGNMKEYVRFESLCTAPSLYKDHGTLKIPSSLLI